MSEVQLQTEVVRVGIAEGAVIRTPGKVRTTGLGSCVGVVLYDSRVGVAGMVHVMLPARPNNVDNALAKYADSAIPWLVESMLAAGAHVSRIRAKLAGGAQMFSFAGKSDIMRVGPRNVEAVEASLTQISIPIVASDVGGSVGRTIEFDSVTEELSIRTALKGIYVI